MLSRQKPCRRQQLRSFVVSSVLDAQLRAKYPDTIATHDFHIWDPPDFVRIAQDPPRWIEAAVVLTDDKIYRHGIRTDWRGRPKDFVINALHGDPGSRDLRDVRDVQSTREGGHLTVVITYEIGTRDILQGRAVATAQEFADLLEQRASIHGRLAESARQPLSIADELLKLSELRAKGVLSDREWETAKEVFLGKPPDRQQTTLGLLSSLHQLYKSGVLSESEFNTKKWDILSQD